MIVKLVVVRGKPAGKVLQVARGKHMIGRGPECQLRPNSEWISRQHCLITVEDDCVKVRDLGSTNGTLVNGRRIVEETVLHDGDVMLLGSLALQLVFENAPDESVVPETQFLGSEKPTMVLDGPPTHAGETYEYPLPELPDRALP